MIEALLVFAFAIGLGWPLGRYLAAVMRGEPMRGDRLFVESAIATGVDEPRE